MLLISFEMIQWRFFGPLKSNSFSIHIENRGGYSVRVVHELTYFIISTDETVCVYKVLQISLDWESLRLSASLICMHPRKLVNKILSWRFQGKTTGITKAVYATVLTVKISELLQFW